MNNTEIDFNFENKTIFRISYWNWKRIRNLFPIKQNCQRIMNKMCYFLTSTAARQSLPWKIHLKSCFEIISVFFFFSFLSNFLHKLCHFHISLAPIRLGGIKNLINLYNVNRMLHFGTHLARSIGGCVAGCATKASLCLVTISINGTKDFRKTHKDRHRLKAHPNLIKFIHFCAFCPPYALCSNCHRCDQIWLSFVQHLLFKVTATFL